MPIGGTTHQIEVEGGRLIPIEFTVPSDGVVAVQVRGAAESGNGTISWWQGPTLQTPKPVSLDGRFYGFDGGEDGSSRINDDIDSRFYKSSRLTVPLYSTETIGATFRAMIRANPGSDLRGSVQIDLFGSQDLPFDSPMPFLVENHSKGDWRYFEIDVPEAAPVAWSVEIESIQDIDSDASRRGRVSAILRRDQALPGGPGLSLQSQTWSSGFQYGMGTDWTGYAATQMGRSTCLPYYRWVDRWSQDAIF